MKLQFKQIACVLLCSFTLLGSTKAQMGKPFAESLFDEGKSLFQQKAFTAAINPLKLFLEQELPSENYASLQTEAAYMLVCAQYETRHPQCVELLKNFLDTHQDNPYKHRIQALIASSHFFSGEYEEAAEAFSQANLNLLNPQERDDMTYRMATCNLKTGNMKEAAIWYDVLYNISNSYDEDCTYYTAYIRYTQNRHEEAMQGFTSLQESEKYGSLAPYYIAEIHLQQKQTKEAEQVAKSYLSKFPNQEHTTEMQRILGCAYYKQGKYHEALQPFSTYMNETNEPRRDALYMYGIASYQCGVYSQVPTLLGEVTHTDDVLSQNAYLHMGLAYLKLADKNKARMAFEQAASKNADKNIKEQAAYNYALCIHETSYSAFGESVTVFEKFLNEFPHSNRTDQIGNYLVEVYMNTRSYDAALASIERIKQPGKNILEAKQRILFHLGTQAFANSTFDKAATYFKQTTAMGNYNRQIVADAFYWLGESNYRLGDVDAAAHHFNQYLTKAPERNTPIYALAYYNLGYIAFNKKAYPTAEKHFLKFVQLECGSNPQALGDTYNRLGDCNLHERRFNDARQYYTKAESSNTSNGDYAYYQQALVAGLQKNYPEKVSLLDNLFQKYPQSPYLVNALYEKGRSYVQMGNSEQAINTFNQVLKNYPESPLSRKAAAEIGLLYYQNEAYDKAIEAYKYVATTYPGSEEARLAMHDLKTLYVETNRVDEYASLTQQLPVGIKFEADEQDSLTYMAAEKVYMKGDTLSARNSFTRYLQSYPNGAFSLNAHYRLAVLANQQGKAEVILQHTTELLKYPDSRYTEEALLMRSRLYFNQQQYAEAMSDYKALQAKASNVERRQNSIIGILHCATQLKNDTEIIQASTTLLADDKLTPELRNEALYQRAKAYQRQHATKKCTEDLKLLAKDTRTIYGAEAKYLLAQQLYDSNQLNAAEEEVLNFIEQSTPHTYWLARSFILLADVYTAQDKKLDARQYLLSLQQNYEGNDDIATMIQERLKKLE